MATAARTPAPPAGLARDQLREIYYYLRLTRSLEERLVNLYRQGRVIGGLFRSLGQEGESVASAYALEPGDVLSPLIRNLGSMLVKGATPVQVLRQYMAKASSPTVGREMNVHFNDLGRGFLGQISHLGDMVPVMAGITLSFKLRGERRVGLVYIGDGATSTGAFHEGVNFAAVQQLPLVVIVEHNGYAYSTPTARQTLVKRLAEKANGYGIAGSTVDGNDVLAVYEATKAAVARARAGEGVSLLEVVTYRRKGHAEHDDQRYQSTDEQAAWAANDPIDRYVARVTEQGWLDPAAVAAVDDQVTAELDAAIASCENDPLPEPATALDGVFAADPSSPVSRLPSPLWFRSLDG
ncbi:MAG TPA: thiamine pyrophosphate-dependent dehydrogenase E1 component subunit alpha [Gemmatimonadales bacterium]|nr:thiamine pyrophosphate-dependent dehydrogenase E1 component subunit alpha [Gemmatimonadales bacterium]